MTHKIHHIAVIRLSAMGDVAMTVPVIRALAQQHDNIKITFVSRPFFEPFFNGIPNVTFFAVDLKNRHKGFLGLIRLFFDLKKLEIDSFADLHNVLRSKIICFFFNLYGIKTAFTDKGRKEKLLLTRLEKKDIFPLKSMIERHLDTFEKLGFQIDLSSRNIGTKFSEKTILSNKISNKIGQFSDFSKIKKIGIAPFAQYESKVYPQDLMQKVIDTLAEKSNHVIFLFGGGKTDIERLNQLKNYYDNVIVIAGKLTLQEELQLISNLDVMLSMDSGNAHIAAMLGVNVITLWGATHPFLGFQPFNQPFDNCLISDRNKYPFLPTSVYGNKEVEGYQDVMRTIPIDHLLSKIEEFLI